MRFTAGLVTATFASLATASSSSSATVRQYNNPPGPEHPVVVSAAEASLGLAELVGVTKLYTLGVQSPNDDRKLELVEKLAGSEGLFEDRSAQLVVSLVGDLKDGRPVMLIDNSPSAAAAKKLVKELAQSRASLSGSTGTLYDVYFSPPKGQCVSTVPVEAKVCSHALPPSAPNLLRYHHLPRHHLRFGRLRRDVDRPRAALSALDIVGRSLCSRFLSLTRDCVRSTLELS